MNLSEFPGYLGWTSQGVIAIHADWPAYPAEHGSDIAILTLGNFPRGSFFSKIDDIDQCILFIYGGSSKVYDPFHFINFHVAIWHKDLIQIQRDGLIEGVSATTENKWFKDRTKEYHDKDLYYKDVHGNLHKIPPLNPDEYDDEWENMALISSRGIQLTQVGIERLHTLILSSKNSIDSNLLEKVFPLIKAELYDAAVRNACVYLESLFRDFSNSSQLYGDRLIKHYFEELSKRKEFISAYVKVFRNEVRAVFKFVRNEYAHKFKEIEFDQCYAILMRISSIVESVKSIGKL